MLHVYAHITTLHLTDNPDYYSWEILGRASNTFSTGDVYTYLRGEIGAQSWTTTVWFPRAIPRHAFNCWLLVLNRSPTRDRLRSWGLQVDAVCLLCNSTDESRNHLYFECNFAFGLWLLVSSRCRIAPHRSWDATMAQLQSLPRDRSTRLLTLLAWQASLYWLWNERNTRLHSSSFRSVDVIFKLLDHQLQNKLQSFRESNPALSLRMMQRWIDTSPP